MPASEQLQALVAQLPDADDRGMLTEGIDKEQIETTIAAIHQAGPEQARGLIELLGEPGSEENVKPHYALHCLANHYLIVGDDEGRRAFCELLGKELGGERPEHVKAYLCQLLGWAGRQEAIAPLAGLLHHESLCAPAAMAITAIGGREAAAALRAAWAEAKGQPRRHLIDALADMADTESSPLFREALSDEDREVRIAASAGVAALADASSAKALLEAAESATGWEKIQATGNCLILAEKLAATGNTAAARNVYQQLRKSSPSDAQHIREAVDRGLAAIG